MIRFLFRTLGFVLLACAVMFAVIDGTKSLTKSELVMTPLRDTWSAINPHSLDLLQGLIEHHAGLFWWNTLSVFVLNRPTFLVAGVLALLLMWLGRLRRRAYI